MEKTEQCVVISDSCTPYLGIKDLWNSFFPEDGCFNCYLVAIRNQDTPNKLNQSFLFGVIIALMYIFDQIYLIIEKKKQPGLF